MPPQKGTPECNQPEPPMVVDLAEGKVHPLPPQLQATLNPIQKRMRSAVGLFLYLLFGFFSVTIPVIGIPPVFFLLERLGVISHWVPQRFFDLCTANWITIMTHLYETLFGVKIRIFGFGGQFKKRSLLLMNHVSHFDWMYLWSVVDKQGDLSFWKAITKAQPLKNLPIIGHCMQLSCFLFISRKWDVDRTEFRDKLYYFNAIDYPLQILLFPEGGDLTTRSRERSDDFAKKNDLPRYQYCLHPRTTGFNYVMNALRDGRLDAIYDISIGYPDTLPKTEVDTYNGFYPKEVHFHIRSFDNKDVPEDEEGMKRWLGDRWREKEDQLRDFYTYSEFRERVSEDACNDKDALSNGHSVNHKSAQRSPEVHLPKNIPYLLYSIFIFIFTNTILIIPLIYIPYFWVYMLFCCFFLAWLTYKDLSKFVMSPVWGDVERTIQRSTRNTP